jgi:hypothetical protein
MMGTMDIRWKAFNCAPMKRQGAEQVMKQLGGKSLLEPPEHIPSQRGRLKMSLFKTAYFLLSM